MSAVLAWQSPPTARANAVFSDVVQAELLERRGEWALLRLYRGHGRFNTKTPAGFEVRQWKREVGGLRVTEVYGRALPRPDMKVHTG